MSGEDIYDVAATRYCHVCDSWEHGDDCDPPDVDLDYECCRCHKRLSDKRYEAGHLFCARCDRDRP